MTIRVVYNGTDIMLDEDVIQHITLVTTCRTTTCMENDTYVYLKVKENGKWQECDGYLDPAKGFKEPKKFARRTMRWLGRCNECGREYETVLRVTQGE